MRLWRRLWRSGPRAAAHRGARERASPTSDLRKAVVGSGERRDVCGVAEVQGVVEESDDPGTSWGAEATGEQIGVAGEGGEAEQSAGLGGPVVEGGEVPGNQ